MSVGSVAAAPPPVVNVGSVVGTGVLGWPVNGTITTYFSSYHLAIDIAAPYGTTIKAADGGVVTWAGWRNNGGGQVVAIEPADLIESQPGESWSKLLDDALEPHFATVSAQLYLKVNEAEKAFPFIEQLARANPRKAKDLAHEFLRVWMRNNNPNTNNRTNAYMFMYGFERRAESIPLTRSKQERNLKELAEWAVRIKKLPGGAGELDDEMMVRAFTACHSSAEVYRTEAIESVFGPMGGLKPKTLAGLVDQMRTNLAGLWKEPAEQQKKKTNRKKKDIEAEVLREWAGRLRGVLRSGLDAYVYFNNDRDGHAVRDARSLTELLQPERSP